MAPGSHLEFKDKAVTDSETNRNRKWSGNHDECENEAVTDTRQGSHLESENEATVTVTESRWSSFAKKFRALVTIEVILFLYVSGAALVRPTVAALVYRKVCLHKYNVTVCDSLDLDEHEHEEEKIQGIASHWYLIENLCFEIPSIFLSTFYGSLSDNMSRKAALMLPAIGQILSTLNYVLNSVYMDLHVGYICIGPLVSGIFGGWVSCGMACFSYLSDITSAESRTWRIGVAEAVLTFSWAIAAFGGGKLLDSTSFQFVFSLSLGLYAIMIPYIVLWIREPPSAKRAANRSCSALWRVVFSPKRVKEALGCIFRKRENNRRVHPRP